MQAELNKYFPAVISNLILEKHYKSMFNDCLSFIKNIAENETILLDDDSDDDDYQNAEISYFRNQCFRRYKYRIRKYRELPAVTDSDNDATYSENEEYEFRMKHHDPDDSDDEY
jgi:hypothetical protein